MAKMYPARDAIFYRDYKIKFSCFTGQYEIYSLDDTLTAFEGGTVSDCLNEIDISYFPRELSKVPEDFYS